MNLYEIITLALINKEPHQVLEQICRGFMDAADQSQNEELKRSYHSVAIVINAEAWRIRKLRKNNMLGEER